jgi:tRNA pseudouridine13 synthase
MEFTRLYKGKRIRGIIKYQPEDFVVEEMPKRHEILEINRKYEFNPDTEGKFLHCVLIKKGVDTFEAVELIRKKLKLKENAITFAGLKDKYALTSQLISIYHGRPEKIKLLSFKDMEVRPLKYGNKVFLGALWGNRFTITVRNVSKNDEEIRNILEKWMAETQGYFPNYYGEQRFGTKRNITHIIGKLIIQRKFEEAVMMYLTRHSEREANKISKIRDLISQKKYKEALELFPKKYSHERIMLKTLVDGGDHKKAFLSLPLTFQRFVINSYQSYLFNRTLDLLVKLGIFNPKLKIPIVGYDYSKKLFREDVDELIEKVLEEENINPSMFYFSEYKHLTTTTHYRKAFGKVHDFELVSIQKDEIFGNNKMILRFALRKSTYATTFLRELVDYQTP